MAEVIWIETAKEAIAYAFSAYWVRPIQISGPDGHARRFEQEVMAVDWSEDGLVHYTKR